MTDQANLFVVAGEESGDLHGSRLIRKILSLEPHIKFYGIGGDRMKAAGVALMQHSNDMAVMGFMEVIKKYPFIKSVFHNTIHVIEKIQPCRAILIDYPGFNLRLAKELKTMGIPITYFISPQLWAWKEGRIRIIRECVDQILCIFPFEEEWYRKRGVEATFIGHPLIDYFSVESCGKKTQTGKNEFFKKHNLSKEKTTIALFPGSRQQEVDQHLPILIHTVNHLKNDGFKVQGIIGKAPGVSMPHLYSEFIAIEEDEPQLALRYADVAISSSGTATLEAAIYGIPTVVIYRMASITWWLAKLMAKVPYASMTNLVAGKEVLPELLQRDATPDRIAETLRPLLESEASRAEMVEELRKVRAKLGKPGAIERGAKLILERLNF